MMATQVRGDKFRAPVAGDRIVVRDRIVNLIEEGLRKRVTAITGPAGSGKTIACASWAAGARSRRVAWLALDEGDRDPRRFWADLSVAARTGRDSGGPGLPVPRSRPGDDQQAAMEDTFRVLGGSAVVILDDVHELAGSAAVTDLNFLLRHAPDAVRIVLSGRWLAGSQVARLRLAGDLAEIGADDLACTPGEAGSYLAGLGLGEADRARLLAYTAGWMGGMRLVALGGQAAADYLRDEVLDRLPPADRLVLLTTSAVTGMTADLAGPLCGEPGADASLDRLSRVTGFLSRGTDGSYSMSPLLRDTLLAELRRERPGEPARLLRRASRWHAARGDAVESLRCAVGAGDWDEASGMLAGGGFFAEMPGRAAELEGLLGEFPAGWRTADPAVAGAFAAARLCAGDRETASVWLTYATRRPRDAGPALTAWLAALRVMLRGADAESRRTAAAAPEAGAPAGQGAAGLLWFALGGAAWPDGDAWNAFCQAERRFRIGLPALLGRVLGWRALAEAGRGDLLAADRLIGQLRDDGDADPAVACLTALAAARVALERDDRGAAAAAIGQADPAAAGWLPCEPDATVIRDRLRSWLDHGVTDTAPVLARAQALLTDGDASGALALARGVLGDQARGPRELITAGIIAALASGGTGEAAPLLEQALAAAAPHGAYLPFLERGSPVRTAISVLIPPTSGAASFASRVLARFQAEQPAAGDGPGEAGPSLTGSELAVLRLLPGYLTNQEIAEALFLSVNTVKTHLRSAYRKLGVTSRRAAVARGRRLGVL